MSHDTEWDSLVRDWKSNDRPPPALTARVRRGTWGRYGAIALGAVVYVAMVVQNAGMLLHGGHPVTLAVGAFVLLLATVVTLFLLRNLLGSLRPEAQTTRAYLELEKRRSQDELRAVKMIRASVLAILAFNLVWAPWKIYVDRAMYAAEPWRLVIGFGYELVILAVLWFPTPFARRRHETRIAAIDEVLAAHAE